MEKQIAAKLHTLRSEISDDTLWMVSVLELVEGANLSVIVKTLAKIQSGKVTVVKVSSSIELSEEQQSSIQSKVSAQFKDTKLVFNFMVDKATDNGLQIKVGDNLIDFSINSKLSEIN